MLFVYANESAIYESYLCMNAQVLGWDELRTVLAIGRNGSLSGAARELGLTHSTVFRRLGSIEKKLRTRLFDRLPTGYAMTEAGEAVVEVAKRVETDILTLERRISGEDLRLGGVLRVTTTDTLGLGLLPAHLAGFRQKYPGVALELVVGNPFFNLTKREADVAVRPTNTPPENAVGRRLCDVATTFYASKAYLDTYGSDLDDQSWLLPDETLAHLPALKWVMQHHPHASVPVRSNSLLGLLEAARCGLGVAPLPCFLGDPDPVLGRVAEPRPEFTVGLWLLTHADLRRTARVRAFLDYMAGAIAGDHALIEGRSGT